MERVLDAEASGERDGGGVRGRIEEVAARGETWLRTCQAGSSQGPRMRASYAMILWATASTMGWKAKENAGSEMGGSAVIGYTRWNVAQERGGSHDAAKRWGRNYAAVSSCSRAAGSSDSTRMGKSQHREGGTTWGGGGPRLVASHICNSGDRVIPR